MMHRQSCALWYCCAFLLVASSAKPSGNSTSSDQRNDDLSMQYEIHANFMGNLSDHQVELMRYNSRESSTKDKDKVHYEFRSNATGNDHEDGDFTQYELETRERNDETSIELRTNSADADSENNSTLHQFNRNVTQVKSRINSISYGLLDNFSKNENNSNVVSYETTCSNSTCIQLCCPLGKRLIKERCIAGKSDNYSFPGLYEYTTSNLLQDEDTTLDQVFSLIVYDPCQGNERYLLNPDDYPDDEYIFFINGSLYQPHYNEFIESTSYCLAVVHRDKYEVAVCFANMTETSEEQSSDGIPIPFGLIVSLPFLLATFVVYSVLPELRNMHGYTLRGYVSSLFVAYMILAVLQLTPSDKISKSVCIALAFVIHFSFLASFFWLNVMCFDIWWTFGGFRSLQGSVKQRERKKFMIYSIYAWGSASILTIICAIMDFVPSVPKGLIRPEFGAERCWFTTDTAKALYFYGPMGVTVVCNICLFISTALKIVRHKKDTAHHLRSSESRRHDDNKQWFSLYLKLFIVMGINWSMEIVSWLFKSAPQYVWYLTDLTNTLQGLIIFIIFVWKEKIKRLLLKRFGCQGRNIFFRNSTRSGYHSSASRTCTTTSGVMPLQEKISSHPQMNCRARSTSEEAEP
ncbi:hypothetical protein DMN91_010865 [Ooceraea biroi]|uniref:G-protein coupled receptors family 2 profile 2 domain-containing protein n=1 Tax=Ooceraea biroi TaxID=2015173 RepID=A0A3L8D8G7_OOCBI|nr:G-protein coupled receptor Mth2 isoform X1 [Ooceraea biroi]RLU16797.1 hypothetical protein DMN91_010865 [Ooceraea biroi]